MRARAGRHDAGRACWAVDNSDPRALTGFGRGCLPSLSFLCSAIFFKPAGKKAVLYDGAREVDAMLDYIKKNGKTIKKKGKGKKKQKKEKSA